jgi:hypothetical protein
MTNRRTILALSIVVLLAKTDWDSVLYAQTGGPTAPTPVIERRVELGVLAGIGQYTYDEIQKPGTRGMISVEACLLCGRRALVMEYSHWMTPRGAGGGARAYRSADSGTVGLRFQGQRRVRPYFDAVVAIGNARAQRSSYIDNITTAGGGVGAGVTVIPADRFYARFGARLMLMSDYYVGANLSVGGGWRF